MIEVRDLSKYYGAKRALGPVTFEIASGECVGFLGLNGAGKTTTLRMLACELRPTAGSIVIDGVDAIEDPHQVRKRVGLLPENAPLYPDMTVRDYLTFAGRLRGLDRAQVAKRLPEVEELTHLRHVDDEVVRNLSHGYRQRVGVAQAIIHEPRLVILDEPTRGLDPVQIVEMRALINGLKHKHTILISSHILPEISQTCDRILVIGGGEIVARGTEDELSERLTRVRQLVVTVRAKPEASLEDTSAAVASCIAAIEGVTSVRELARDGHTITFQADCEADRRVEVVDALVHAGHGVARIDVAQQQLEGIFMQLVGRKSA